MILYLVVTYLGTLVLGSLGYLQTRQINNSLPSSNQQHTNDEFYGMLAIAAICVQALVTICVWGGTSLFPLGSVLLALTLSSHHAVIHRHSKFEGETLSCACFQVKDVSNHETWVVCSIVAGVVSLAHL